MAATAKEVAVAVAIVCVVVAWLAAAVPPVGGAGAGGMGGSAVGMELLMAARGGGGSRRVEDEEVLEMDSEAHRRVVLALRGQPSAAEEVLDAKRTWCDHERSCTGKPGDPYVPDPRGCLKIYHCPGATNSLSD